MATMTHTGPRVGGARYDKLESLLVKQDALMRMRRQALRQGAVTEAAGVKDSEEHSVDGGEAGIGFAVLELSSQMVQEIETALGRMREGTYGTCPDCGHRIGAVRLRAVSFAERCRECQERGDSQLSHRVQPSRLARDDRRGGRI